MFTPVNNVKYVTRATRVSHLLHHMPGHFSVSAHKLIVIVCDNRVKVFQIVFPYKIRPKR